MMVRALFAGLLMAAVTAPPAWGTNLPVKDFVRHREFQQVHISPSGKYLAVVSSSDKHPNRYTLAIFNTQSILKGKPKLLNNFTLRNYKMFGPVFWVNNDRIAAETETYVGGFDHPYLTGALYAVDADGGNPVRLMPWNNQSAFAGYMSLLPNKRNYILVQADTLGNPIAYMVDTRGSNGLHHAARYYYKRAESPTNGPMLADHNGEVRLAFGYNTLTGDNESFYRAEGQTKWQKYKLPTYVDTNGLSLPQLVDFTSDNKKIYITENINNKNREFNSEVQLIESD